MMGKKNPKNLEEIFFFGISFKILTYTNKKNGESIYFFYHIITYGMKINKILIKGYDSCSKPMKGQKENYLKPSSQSI